MVNPRISPAAGLQSTNQVPLSIDIEEADDIPEERIDLTGNKRNREDSDNSDCGDEDEKSLQIKEEGLEALQSALEPAKDAGPSPMVTTPKRKDLSHIGKMEPAFKNGYDSDGNKGIYWGETHLEGEQLFEEETIPPWVSAAAAADIENVMAKDSGNANSSNKDSGNAADSGKDNNRKLPALNFATIKKPTLVYELQLRLLCHKGNKPALIERLKQAIKAGVKRYESIEAAAPDKKQKKKKKKEKRKK